MKYSYGSLISAILFPLILINCTSTTKQLYYWGQYEQTIYEMYTESGKNSVKEDIIRLEEQIDRAESKGKSVPPGFHAHLGYLYYIDGNYNTTLLHFRTEKKLFPESSIFIDGMLRRMKKDK